MRVVARGFLPFNNKTFNLTIVDGFAGGGKYLYENKEVDGSPLILLNAVQAASSLIQIEREGLGRDSLNINTDFFFVEKEKAAFEYLQSALTNREEYRNNKVRVMHGEFDVQLPEIIQFIKEKSRGRRGRAIFILDQCGFSQVLLSQIRQIMDSLEAECILTFAVDALVAYLCENQEITLRKFGFTEDDIRQIRKQDDPNQCRDIIQHVLSRHILEMGFSFTPFCIYGDTSNWGYWLVHLSKHYRARDEMMQVHWDKGTELVHYGGAGIDMFGYRSNTDERHTGQYLLGDEFRFDFNAKKKVLNSLREEIPELIYQRGSIQHSDLLNETSNHTPANREMISEVLWEGVESKEFSIRRRNAKNIKDGDVITASRQMVIRISRNR